MFPTFLCLQVQTAMGGALWALVHPMFELGASVARLHLSSTEAALLTALVALQTGELRGAFRLPAELEGRGRKDDLEPMYILKDLVKVDSPVPKPFFFFLFLRLYLILIYSLFLYDSSLLNYDM